MAYLTGKISIVELAKPVAPLPGQKVPEYLYDEEDQFYGAYIDRMDVAKELGRAHKYFDGIHYLNISSECFLKYVFCLVRHQIYTRQNFKAVAEEKTPFDFATTFLFARNTFTAQSFSHDLNLLVRFLIRFTDADGFPEFRTYIRNLSSGTKWINTRYESSPHMSHKQKYDDYFNGFDRILNGCFKGIK